MMVTTQHKATQEYRRRLRDAGMARFEVVGLAHDRPLIRRLAKLLSDGGQAAEHLRSLVHQGIQAEPQRGGIFAALRQSPLVGEELVFEREQTDGRPIDL